MNNLPTIKHYCTYPDKGGAGIAAGRLVSGLREHELPVNLYGIGTENNPNTYIKPIFYSRSFVANLKRRWRSWQINHLPDGYVGLSQKGAPFFSDRSVHGLAMAESFTGAGILHFHWVCDMLDYQHTFQKTSKSIPIVWTLHDMGAFTGGCSYSFDCDKFQKKCCDCPQLTSVISKDEAEKSLYRKVQSLSAMKKRITLVCPSSWLAKKVRKSNAFKGMRCEVIPNGFDLECFHPGHRKRGRKRMQLRTGEMALLFVAASVSNPLKGMDLLRNTLPKIEADYETLKVFYLGDKGENTWPGTWTWLGKITDANRLAEIYAGADVLLAPSLADNYPNVIAESLACGLPVVASKVGGIPEMVIEEKTGALFMPANAASFTSTLRNFLSNLPQARSSWSDKCRHFAEITFEKNNVISRHIELYQELMEQPSLDAKKT